MDGRIGRQGVEQQTSAGPTHRRRDAAMVSELEGEILPPALSRHQGLEIKVPRQIERAGGDAIERYLEFFLARIRNLNTRDSYHYAVQAFFTWCTAREIYQLQTIKALHVSTYIEGLEQGAWDGKRFAASSIKTHLAALRSFFNWLEVCGHVSRNPTSPVAGPSVRREKGLTPALTRPEARRLLDSIMVEQQSTKSGLIEPDLLGHRDRALIAFMIYSCARVGAALAVKVSDLQRQEDPESGRSVLWVTLHEKRGKILKRPCHEVLDLYLTTYLELNGFGPDAWLFPSYSHPKKEFTGKALERNSARRMIQRRAEAAGLSVKIGNHSLRATGIRAIAEATGSAEAAQLFAGHESKDTTDRYLGERDLITPSLLDQVTI